jgi:hypothetical protein
MVKTKLVSLFLLVAVLFAFSGLNAKDLPGDKAGRKSDYLYKKLGLSLDQYTKTYQAFLAYEFKVEDNMKMSKKDKAVVKDANAKAKTALLGELGKVFNKEQNEKFGKMSDKVIDMKFKKKVRKTKTEEGKKEEGKKEEKKDVKKEEKKDTKKDVKKEEKKDTKKEEKKDVKKEEKKK